MLHSDLVTNFLCYFLLCFFIIMGIDLLLQTEIYVTTLIMLISSK